MDIVGTPFKGKIDTIDHVKHIICANTTIRALENYQLATLYHFATGLELEKGHKAKTDAKVTISIF